MRSPRLLTDGQLVARTRELLAVLARARYDWYQRARPEQLEPVDPYDVWLILAGRGWGKTHTGANTVRKWANAKRRGHFCVVAKTHREVQAICFEARDAGLLAVTPPEEVEAYKRSPVMLTLTNGSVIRAFSAEDPDALRGYAFDGAWLDEYAAWPRNVAQDVFDMVWFCLREAVDPKVLVTTTPKNLPHVRELVAGPPGLRVHITRGHTRDNAANLSSAALAVLTGRYAGTRLGRQELGGELLTDVQGALLTAGWIEAGRRRPLDVAALSATVVAVDPAVSAHEADDGASISERKKKRSDETGIVTVGVDAQAHGYVLADDSGTYSPEQWTRKVWLAAIHWQAHAVVVEDNQGGDMVEHALKVAWLELQREARVTGQELHTRPVIVRVHPSGPMEGKWLRAQPIALLYEQEPPRIHHVTPDRVGPDGVPVPGWVNPLDKLEDQACTWTGDKDEPSPDRVDAMVHGLSWLLFPQRRRQTATKQAPVAAPARSRWGAGARR